MNDTPRTDEVYFASYDEAGEAHAKLYDHACQLECELAQVRRRLNWAANELLACDYGDNPEKRGIGWSVFGWRDVNGIHSVVPYEKVRRIYGKSIDEAIDAFLASPTGSRVAS